MLFYTTKLRNETLVNLRWSSHSRAQIHKNKICTMICFFKFSVYIFYILSSLFRFLYDPSCSRKIFAQCLFRDVSEPTIRAEPERTILQKSPRMLEWRNLTTYMSIYLSLKLTKKKSVFKSWHHLYFIRYNKFKEQTCTSIICQFMKLRTRNLIVKARVVLFRIDIIKFQYKAVTRTTKFFIPATLDAFLFGKCPLFSVVIIIVVTVDYLKCWWRSQRTCVLLSSFIDGNANVTWNKICNSDFSSTIIFTNHIKCMYMYFFHTHTHTHTHTHVYA